MVSFFIENYTFVQFGRLSGPISKQRDIRAFALLKRLGGGGSQMYIISPSSSILVQKIGKFIYNC